MYVSTHIMQGYFIITKIIGKPGLNVSMFAGKKTFTHYRKPVKVYRAFHI